MQVKISILSNNIAGPLTRAEHGLSLLFEADGKKIIFDTGQSDLFLRNAEIMNVSVADAEVIILSHGHFDHGNGLEFLKGGTLICHPGCFIERYRGTDSENIGLKNNLNYHAGRFNLIISKEPYKISEKLIFLGEIPRETSFESRKTPFLLKDGSPDFIIDDSALSVETNDGLFIITGCGHSGVVNTIMHAKRITGVNRIAGIMGGFHLKDRGIQTEETIKYLESEKVRHILPMHCTELPALSAFYEKFMIRQVRTGDSYAF